MVKCGIILIFLLLAAMPISYAAVTVMLTNPLGSVSSNNSVTFSCNAESNSSPLSNMALYFGNEITWHQNKSIAVTGMTNSTSFAVNGIPNGNFMWNCKAIDSLNAEFLSPANNTFTVNVPPPAVNSPPSLKLQIPGRKWYVGEAISLILQDYFEDSDGGHLAFSVTGNSNINITIQDGYVVLTPAAGWVGTERVIFTASDGVASVPSNEVLLNVTEKNGKPNQPPVLLKKSPLEKIYSPIRLGEIFSVTVADPENGTVSYNWKLDGAIVGNGPSYALNSAISGNHTLIVEYSDGINSGNYSWALNVGAALNAPLNNSQPAKAQPIALVCGDGKRDVTENCQSCPKDAPCDRGFKCVNGGKCQKKSVLPLVVTIIFIFMALLTAGYFAYEYLLKDKIARLFMKKEVQPSQKEVVSIQKAVAAPSQGQVKPDFLVQKPVIGSGQKPEIIPEKKTAMSAVQQPKPIPVRSVKKEDTLKLYVTKMFGKGHSLQEISNNLQKAGWSKVKIDEAIKAIKLSEAPSRSKLRGIRNFNKEGKKA